MGYIGDPFPGKPHWAHAPYAHRLHRPADQNAAGRIRWRRREHVCAYTGSARCETSKSCSCWRAPQTSWLVCYQVTLRRRRAERARKAWFSAELDASLLCEVRPNLLCEEKVLYDPPTPYNGGLERICSVLDRRRVLGRSGGKAAGEARSLALSRGNGCRRRPARCRR